MKPAGTETYWIAVFVSESGVHTYSGNFVRIPKGWLRESNENNFAWGHRIIFTEKPGANTEREAVEKLLAETKARCDCLESKCREAYDLIVQIERVLEEMRKP